MGESRGPRADFGLRDPSDPALEASVGTIPGAHERIPVRNGQLT